MDSDTQAVIRKYEKTPAIYQDHCKLLENQTVDQRQAALL